MTLGAKEDVFRVPIVVNRLSTRYSCRIDIATDEINQAAPGLCLYKSESPPSPPGRYGYIKIVGKSEKCASTEGNIFKSDVARITLGDDFNVGMEGRTIVHELLHALGFPHEHCRIDAQKHVTKESERTNDNIDPNEGSLPLTRFDPLSVKVCQKNDVLDSKRKPDDDPIWIIKGDGLTYNTELSELDKVGLNLFFRPCKTDTYQPELSPDSGLYYCGRPVMKSAVLAVKIPAEICGPTVGPDCPACRTIKNVRVQKINHNYGERWQGLSGLFYCGKRIGVQPSGQDMYCGPDNGPQCPECEQHTSQMTRKQRPNQDRYCRPDNGPQHPGYEQNTSPAEVTMGVLDFIKNVWVESSSHDDLSGPDNTPQSPEYEQRTMPTRKKGTTGLYYCGKYFGVQWPGHDGYCGPDNGPQCSECESEHNTLPKETGLFDFRVGQGNQSRFPEYEQNISPTRKKGTTGLYYCGKYFGVQSPRHDGYCGPDNGPQCPECKQDCSNTLPMAEIITGLFSAWRNFGLGSEQNASPTRTGPYYCGKYFGVQSPCHDGYCGPDNGPQCPECSR